MDLYELSIADAHKKILQHDLTPLDLLENLLNRIWRLEPYVEAWVTMNTDEARKQAEGLTEESERGIIRGPLHGIPIGVKDIYYTDKLLTTMGSAIYREFIPGYDADVVSKLKDAGAIILGKTETTEFASSDPAPTRNPWNLEYTPGGSSSGSAAAVSSGMCPTALGSQTGGSVIRPAAFCGIVGMKPTYDLISRKGVYPLSWSLDHIGFFTRTVKDAALVFDTITENKTSRSLKELKPPKVGMIKEYFTEKASIEVKEGYIDVVEMLKKSGLSLEEFKLPKSFSAVHHAHRVIMATETASVHEDNYRSRRSDYRPNISGIIASGLLVPSSAYLKAQRIRDRFIREMYTGLREYHCVITPSAPTPALKGLESTGNSAFNSPWSLCGFPSITVPSGFTEEGLPLGIQLVSSPYNEINLLKAAKWFENLLDFPKKPREPYLPDLQ